MKRLLLDHLYSGQVLAPTFMYLAPMNPEMYPIDHGYEIYYQGKCLGECRVIERRSVKIGDITDSLSHIACGRSHTFLQLDLAKRMGQIHDDTRVYVLCFQYIRVYQPFTKAATEHLDSMLLKNPKPLSYQTKF
jgi:hypothetical protein